MSVCSRPRCARPVRAKGLCGGCYAKHHRAGRGEYRRLDPAEVVAHIARLRAKGWTWPMLGEASGLSISVPHQVFTGVRKRVSRHAAVRLLAIPVEWVESPVIVGISGTRRRVQALARMGWPADVVATRCGLYDNTLKQALSRGRVTARIAARVAELYDELSDTPGPSSRAAARAATLGYAPPAAWDDDTIDDPHAGPNYTGYDEDRVQAYMTGEKPAGLTKADRVEAAARLVNSGLTPLEAARVLGTTALYVQTWLGADAA
jgi:lambda repressor-like predicted transcriptional regulator